MAIWGAYQRVLQRLQEKAVEENLGGSQRRAEGGRESGQCLCRAALRTAVACGGGFGEVTITDAPDYQAGQKVSRSHLSN
jgi:hypothetical protein